MSNSPYIYDVTVENFQQIVVDGSFQVPVLVDFWAEWCGPCKTLMPLLAQLTEAYQGRFILAKINTEEQQAIAAQFGIRSIPTVKLFIEGAEVDEFAGALPESEIRAFIDRHLPNQAAGVIESAQQLMGAGQFEQALELLAPAQSADPSNSAILLTMAQAHAALGNYDAANFALDNLPEDQRNSADAASLRSQMHFASIAPPPDEVPALQQRFNEDPSDSEAHYKLALVSVLQGETEQAIDMLLALMARDRDYGEDAARNALLKIFEMLGEQPLAAAGRRRMFNLLH